ncbi:hypothetical protein Rhe02_55650 [Rhizocola hellebori]|uniref:Uncharacterized protein n=1 Tax=Rhizocola hellebori TaxID=1392758 RepID=A0A8J3VJ03_9ACTN|nr:hypothetical protein [Rhizocola hellebori]GIH07498.1 hypothetical protein Rhe02_55650 [Rhizocola hellebori]
MAFTHGKNTVVILGGANLSAFSNTSTMTRKADKHDVTCYGKDDHVYEGGLGDGAASIGGTYDNTAAGPRDVIEPLIGQVVPFVRRPEGTGAGKPQDSMNVLVEEYVETSPVADFVTWSVKLQPSDAVNSTDQ